MKESVKHEKHTFTFSWQEQGEGFLKWLLPTLLADVDDELVGRLRDATSGFTDVQLTMQVNGVEVPTQGMLEGLERNVERIALDTASEILDEYLNISDVAEALHDLTTAVRVEVRRRARQLGVELPTHDEDS